MFGCMGDKAEAAIECLHHECNKSNRLLAAIPAWSTRTRVRIGRRRQLELPSVVNKEVRIITGLKRKLSLEILTEITLK